MQRVRFPGHLLSPALSSIRNGGEGVGDAGCERRFLKARHSQRGVALVLTLIMLALITIVAVVFLATTRRNRLTTGIQSDRTDAEFAAEAGYQHATGKILEQVLINKSLNAVEFIVSRTNGVAGTNFVPVVTNRFGTVNFYLDLNRNRRFDSNFYGDPIWIGVLDKPRSPHAPNNRAVARFAYMVQPVGKSLDLNTAHNDTSPNPGYGFLRNQGFGPWELNLAAFFHELDPVIWDYDYSGAGRKPAATGAAFADARSFLNYLHGWPGIGLPPGSPPTYPDALSLALAYNLAANVAPADATFPPASIDAYSDGFGGTVLGADAFLADDDFPTKTLRWPGADKTNHFFHIQEFFDHALNGVNGNVSNKVTLEFFDRLTTAITNDASGSLYYRMLSQLATDTGDAIDDRIHLFYADKHAGPGYAPTNFIPWDSSPELKVSFYTNVAQRLFLAQSNEFNAGGTNGLPIRSILEIPIYPTNQYSSAIHRILQVAANILDANSTALYPSVFRPLFGAGPIAGANYIVGYTNDDQVSTLPAWLNSNTNGIPLVIGAKKGFPNFNEFTMRTDMLVSRKVQVTRPSAVSGTPTDGTNVMYMLGISNNFGVEAWNSYSKVYPRPVLITVSNITALLLTNGLGYENIALVTSVTVTNLAAGQWLGGETLGFLQPVNTNVAFLANSAYRFKNNTFDPIRTNTFEGPGDGVVGFPLPYWLLTVSNRMTYLMQEGNRIVDFVLLNAEYTVDLHRDLVANQNPYPANSSATPDVFLLWNTNRTSPTAPTRGIRQQIDMASGTILTRAADWRAYALTGQGIENDKQVAIEEFRAFIGLGPQTAVPFTSNMLLKMQAPFNPAAKLVVVTSWQANDPLVHYHLADLTLTPTNLIRYYYTPNAPSSNAQPASLGRLNSRYAPWGLWAADRDWSENTDLSVNFRIKDPGIYTSDNWVFPTNKMASIGLLGRVHRGTPWQTVYFKAERAPLDAWQNQSSDLITYFGTNTVGTLLSRTHPTNDWRLADLFTTALDGRGARGLVSLNQTNMETWSALFSGVLVLSNSLSDPVIGDAPEYEERFIEPWGANALASSGFAQIWTNFYAFQTNQLVQGRSSQSLGELIQNVPELTTKSPFLNQSSDDLPRFGIDDFAYEQIPQQILSLLRAGAPQSRFAIYAYGQSLKPAQIDPGSGLVVNYQVTAEFATRTVIRVEGNPNGRLRTVVESFNVLPPD